MKLCKIIRIFKSTILKFVLDIYLRYIDLEEIQLSKKNRWPENIIEDENDSSSPEKILSYASFFHFSAQKRHHHPDGDIETLTDWSNMKNHYEYYWLFLQWFTKRFEIIHIYLKNMRLNDINVNFYLLEILLIGEFDPSLYDTCLNIKKFMIFRWIFYRLNN